MKVNKTEREKVMFGKESSEALWITGSVKNERFYTCEKSHSAVCITTLSASSIENHTLLTMSFLLMANYFWLKRYCQ